ncbi:concanavalin A-like lectin/glucanase domain-containing protein [Xylariaceae sp. AK1471]|nr:concanavalin A-like lectin/glucanase domain-containing protein [Xylariaceae sp. AK1471]
MSFTFDVDLSTVDCGLNAALYFVAMEADGGMKSYSSNKAGAKYDLKFVAGKANIEDGNPLPTHPNAGVGPYGACCAEMDWLGNSNSHSFAFTPHPYTNNAYHVCETSGCGDTYSNDRFAGDCDPNGCGYNPYRILVQNGKKIEIPGSPFDGIPSSSTITPDYCKAQFRSSATAIASTRLEASTKSMLQFTSPMVLVISI